MTDSTTVRIAVITGAGSGVGRASALGLLRHGWTVVLNGRRIERLEETQAMAGDDAARTLAIAADVSTADGVASLFAQVRETYGRLDMLFNNAGGGSPPVLLEDLTLEQWQRVVDLNLTGAFLCTQEAFRIMKDQDPRGGRIINNGSISADRPRPNSAPYTSTKHALTGLTKSIALDGRKYDIAGGQIDIGNALTEMTGGMGRGVPQPSGERMAEPTFDVEHVADAPLDAAVELHLVRVLGLLHQVRERGVDAVQRGVDELPEAAHLVPVAHAEAAAEVAPGAELQQAIHQANRPRDPDHHQGHQQLDPDQQGDQQPGADVQAQSRQPGGEIDDAVLVRYADQRSLYLAHGCRVPPSFRRFVGG